MLKIVCPRLSSLTRLTSANSNSLFPLSDDEEQEYGMPQFDPNISSQKIKPFLCFSAQYWFKTDFKHVVV